MAGPSEVPGGFAGFVRPGTSAIVAFLRCETLPTSPFGRTVPPGTTGSLWGGVIRHRRSRARPDSEVRSDVACRSSSTGSLGVIPRRGKRPRAVSDGPRGGLQRLHRGSLGRPRFSKNRSSRRAVSETGVAEQQRAAKASPPWSPRAVAAADGLLSSVAQGGRAADLGRVGGGAIVRASPPGWFVVGWSFYNRSGFPVAAPAGQARTVRAQCGPCSRPGTGISEIDYSELQPGQGTAARPAVFHRSTGGRESGCDR